MNELKRHKNKTKLHSEASPAGRKKIIKKRLAADISLVLLSLVLDVFFGGGCVQGKQKRIRNGNICLEYVFIITGHQHVKTYN